MEISRYEFKYHIPPDKLADIRRYLLRYCDADGHVSAESNPNGSQHNIAGIVSAGGNVLGMMPHPERHVEKCVGSDDGRWVFESLLHHFETAA